MTTDLLKSIDDLKGIWIIGSSALDKSPVAWKEAVQHLEHPELGLLTLAGQAISFAMKPLPARELVAVPTLPRLRLPSPPEPARQVIRHLLRVVKLNEAQMAGVIRLLAARGYAVNPMDYMPRSFAQWPDLYAPWEAWERAELANSQQSSSINNAEINSENWDQLSPAERRMALMQLRQQNPSVARELLAEKIASLPAEERFRLLELLVVNLSGDDQSFLETLVQDRSSKVKQLSQQYLARLGAAPCLDDDNSEFVNFYSINNTDLNGSVKIAANALKTPAQKKRRAVLAAKISLHSFAAGLKLSSDDQLVTGWDHVDPQASDEFVRIVASTGSEKAVALLAKRIESLDGISAESLQMLFERLRPQSRRELLPRILSNDEASFGATLMCCGDMLGEIPWKQLGPTLAFKELLKISHEEFSANVVKREKLRQGLYALGLIADRIAAEEVLKIFTANNFFASDPLLSVLKLNTCLPYNDCLPPGDEL
ncbi:MAG: DUF5691 domain-containing protein [Pirellula sp.]|jgi:hypothetical protein|nr:DUF5691 domain-containing protein [Pirellula sp.]